MSRRWAFLCRRASSSSGDVSRNQPPSLRLVDDADDALHRCHLAVSAAEDGDDDDEGDRWSRLLPEILTEIIKRVETSEDRWPQRRSVVVCACICRKWREITTGLVRSTTPSGIITFPCSLKQPGPRDTTMQCFVKRDTKNSTFSLHLGVADAFKARGKFLMAAQRHRLGAYTEYILSINSEDLCGRSNANAYMGKLRSDFLGTKFTFYDSRSPYDGAEPSSNSRSGRRFASKKICPQVPASNFKVGHINYQFNLLKSRGPRRMRCALQLPPAINEVGPNSKGGGGGRPESLLLLKNKTPRWHEHLQCWCLNFHGRVTVASVKNFQLVSVEDEESVMLQFGKIGDDLFNMDYRYPLSAFHAFIICLTSFGTKIACE